MPIAAFNANDPYEQLIAQILSIERQPQIAIRSRQESQKVFKAVLTDFNSTLSALNASLDGLKDPVSNPFTARSATVPESAGFGVTASDRAATGSHTLQVERLAATDTRLSQRFERDGTSLRSFFDTNGAQTFTIDVASPTDEEPERRVGIAVTVEPEGATDADILGDIRTAINDAMSAAAADGTISADDKAGASLVNETSDTARLTLRSGDTGFANRLSFTDSGNGLLSLLQLDRAALAGDTGAGGQVTAVGTSETDSALNSVFKLDGLTLYRSSNEVTDALDGLTLSLDAVGEAAAFSVGPDSDAIVKDVEAFIKKYNDAHAFIKRKSNIDPDVGARGDFAGDSAITSLRFGMRNDALRTVASQPDGAPARFADLGIEINDDGTLKLADREQLLTAVEASPDAVQSFFAADDGVATRLSDRLGTFLGTDGILKRRTKTIEDKIGRYDKQITRWEERLTMREDQLRMQYAQLQESLALLQGQQDSLNSFFY
jgi:flagellar hook-associated protein 2